jgi:hypothetical protein
LAFIKSKNFCASKDTINRVKEAHRMEEIYADNLSDKDFMENIKRTVIQ